MNNLKSSRDRDIVIDWRKEEASSLVLPKAPTLSSQKEILQEVGVGLNYYSEPPHEVPESSNLQHIIVVSFGQSRVERKMGDRKQIESLENGSVALIPAHVNHAGIAYNDCLFSLVIIEPKSLANNLQEVTNFDCFELIPTFAKPDPLIYGIAQRALLNQQWIKQK